MDNLDETAKYGYKPDFFRKVVFYFADNQLIMVFFWESCKNICASIYLHIYLQADTCILWKPEEMYFRR